jgi:O-methyltransferase
VTLVKGYFEETLSAWGDRQFSVVHIDCDLYQSYLTCLDFFYPRMVPGGHIVFDEYDFIADVYPGAQKAIDEFLADKPEKITGFPESPIPRYFIVKQ